MPGEYRSIDLLKLSGNRINKRKDHVWFTSADNETLDDWRVESTINGYSFSRHVSSVGDTWIAPTLPTQGFVERYPVVGPFVMSRIGILPVSCQFVRITNIRPHATNKNLKSFNVSSSLVGRSSHKYMLHFDMHEKIVEETESGSSILNSGAMEIPGVTGMYPGDHHYLVGPCTPEEFVEIHPDIALDDVSGPWDGFINPNGDHVALYTPWGQCCKGAFMQEEVNWKPEAPWPVYPSSFFDEDDLGDVNNTVSSTTPGIRTFEIERVSLTSVANEPRNWRRVLSAFDEGEADDAVVEAQQNALYPPDPEDFEGQVGLPLRCSVTEPCPYIDDCTVATCNLTAYTCSYTALACNHPNWTRCYPETKMSAELATEYNVAVTEVSSRTTGHGIGDLYWMGVYYPDSVETQYWNFLCTNVSIDCVVSDWGPAVGECTSCGDSLPRSRVVIAESVGNGINCASVPLTKQVPCNASGVCDDCLDFDICPTPSPTPAPTPVPPVALQQEVDGEEGDASNVGAVVGAIIGSVCAVLLILLAFAALTRRSRATRVSSLASTGGVGGRRRAGSTAGERGYYKQGSSSKLNRRSNRSSARFASSPLGGPSLDATNGDVRASDFRSATSMYQAETPRQSNLQYAALPPETPVAANGPPPPPRRGGGAGPAPPPPPATAAAHPNPVRPPRPAAAEPAPAPADSGAWMQF
jgi:hypothetical protein